MEFRQSSSLEALNPKETLVVVQVHSFHRHMLRKLLEASLFFPSFTILVLSVQSAVTAASWLSNSHNCLPQVNYYSQILEHF